MWIWVWWVNVWAGAHLCLCKPSANEIFQDYRKQRRLGSSSEARLLFQSLQVIQMWVTALPSHHDSADTQPRDQCLSKFPAAPRPSGWVYMCVIKRQPDWGIRAHTRTHNLWKGIDVTAMAYAWQRECSKLSKRISASPTAGLCRRGRKEAGGGSQIRAKPTAHDRPAEHWCVHYAVFFLAVHQPVKVIWLNFNEWLFPAMSHIAILSLFVCFSDLNSVHSDLQSRWTFKVPFPP